jgi:hypothetical protein
MSLPRGQFGLRTLLLAIMVFAISATIAHRSFRCSYLRSLFEGIVAATLITSLAGGAVNVVGDAVSLHHIEPTFLFYLASFVFGGIVGAMLGFACSVLLTVCLGLPYVVRIWMRDRPDLYYLESKQPEGNRPLNRRVDPGVTRLRNINNI